jgi:ketosteroid isomerase-like protein
VAGVVAALSVTCDLTRGHPQGEAMRASLVTVELARRAGHCTLRPVPELFMPDGAGHVAVLTRITGTRPDGRSFDDTQVLYVQLEDGKVRSVDQFIGDPPAVTDFWA